MSQPLLSRILWTAASIVLSHESTSLTGWAEDHAFETSKSAVERGLTFLARDALAWRSEHNCSSCHHAALIVWAFNEAKLRGHAVDEPVLADLTKWLTEGGDGRTGVPRPESAPRALNTKAVYYAIALGSVPKPNASEREALGRFLTTVQADQVDNGSWVAWPETRPPIFGHSDQIVTALATLALLSGVDSGDPSPKTNADRGFKWLSEAPLDDEMQSLALRVLLRTRLGRSTKDLSLLVKQIEDRQNSDGGWGQAPGHASDAWATGQTLYALACANVAPTHRMMTRARSFLMCTQSADGSWAMKSRPSKPGGSGADNLIPITGAGSAWAVMGLVRSQPPIAE